ATAPGPATTATPTIAPSASIAATTTRPARWWLFSRVSWIQRMRPARPRAGRLADAAGKIARVRRRGNVATALTAPPRSGTLRRPAERASRPARAREGFVLEPYAQAPDAVRLVREAMAAFVRGDIDALVSFVHPDAEIEMVALGGATAHGPEGLRAALERAQL